MPAGTRKPALLALAVLTLIWSYNWIVMKQAMAYSGPITFSALRYGFGTLMLFGVLALRGDSLRPPPLAATAWIGLAQTTGFQLLVQGALVSGGAGKVALLAYTMPFWVVLLGWLALSVRPTRAVIAGLLLAATGLVLVLEPWHGLGGATSSLLAIGGGLCWAVGVLLSRRLLERGAATPLSLTAWQMAIGTAAIIVIALMVPERSVEWSGAYIGALAYNAVLASGVAWLLWTFIVARLPASVAGISSLAIPIVGVGLAWVLLGERPSPAEGLGILLLCAALAVVTLRPAR